jgi:hypothetical protein
VTWAVTWASESEFAPCPRGASNGASARRRGPQAQRRWRKGGYAAAQVLGNQRLASRRLFTTASMPRPVLQTWRERRKFFHCRDLGVLRLRGDSGGHAGMAHRVQRVIPYAASSASSRPTCVPRGPWKCEPSGRPAVLSCGAFVRGTRQLAHAGVAACRLMGPQGSRSISRRAVEIARCSPAARVAKEGEVFARESVRAQRGVKTQPHPEGIFRL